MGDTAIFSSLCLLPIRTSSPMHLAMDWECQDVMATNTVQNTVGLRGLHASVRASLPQAVFSPSELKNFWNTALCTLRTIHIIQKQTSSTTHKSIYRASEAQAMADIHISTLSDTSLLFLVLCSVHPYLFCSARAIEISNCLRERRRKIRKNRRSLTHSES